MNLHIKEFSKRARGYQRHNYLQKEIAKRVVSKVKNRPKNILDLGCGGGEIFKNIDWEFDNFIAVDFAINMCKLHPKNSNITIINSNFDDETLFDELKSYKIDTIISSSAFQWSKDLNKLAYNISKITNNIYLSIFTNKTFKTINKTANLTSILPSNQKVIDIFKKRFKIDYKIESYKLYFDDKLSIFRYIKESGVSGGVQRLNFLETKKLIKNYPLNFLEFEVVYLFSK